MKNMLCTDCGSVFCWWLATAFCIISTVNYNLIANHTVFNQNSTCIHESN